MRIAINAAVIQDRKVLLVRKKQTWILPGGKPEVGEPDIECLCREVKDELSGTKIKNIILYKEFEGITPHKKDNLRARVYFAELENKLGSPSAEILEHKWMSFNDALDYRISDITTKVINALKEDNYL